MSITVDLTNPPLAQTARELAQRGRPVVPCQPGEKPPLWGLGWQDASTDPEVVATWWGREPHANIGLACVGQLVVLDIDGPRGRDTLAKLEARHGLGPATYSVMSGREDGGEHRYYLRTSEVQDGWRYGDLELKAHGYVLAPPSLHPSGSSYYATNPELPLWPLPSWLARSPRPQPQPRTANGTQDPKRLRASADAAMQDELAKLASHSTDSGTGRHTALYAAACALGRHVAAGGLSYAEAYNALQAGSQALGLAWNSEGAHQVEKGLGDGMSEPYVLTERPAPVPVNGQAPPSLARREVRTRTASAMRVRLVDWGWEQRVPMGKLTILGGLAGQGKSQLSTWMGARLSTGTLHGDLWGEPVHVVMVSAEDDPEDTILPRLILAGADLERIHLMDMRTTEPDGKVSPGQVELPGDTLAVRAELERVKARAVILDPTGGLLDDQHDSYKAQHVRRALAPLKSAVEELRLACLLVTHVSPKSSGTDPLSRLVDSHAFTGLPRSVLILGPDPGDDLGDRGSRKVLTVAKSNVAGPGEHGLAFMVVGPGMVSDGHRGYGMASHMELIGPTEVTTADTLGGSGDRSPRRYAEEWLAEQLAEGPKQARTLQVGAKAEGISGHMLRDVRERICKRPYKTMHQGPSWWELRPPEDLPPHIRQDWQDWQDSHASRAGSPVSPASPAGEGGHIVQLFPDDDVSDDTKDPPEET